MKNTIRTSLLLTGLLAVSSLTFAQVPNTTKGGEATTMSQGQINPVDKSPKSSDTTRAAVKSEAAANNKMSNNKTTGMGEASTTGPNGQANMLPAKDNPTTSGMASPGMSKKDEAKAAARNPSRAAESAK
ncbi:MAG: hypothetical protein V4505_07440 [Pseudomonadota bacterium]